MVAKRMPDLEPRHVLLVLAAIASLGCGPRSDATSAPGSVEPAAVTTPTTGEPQPEREGPPRYWWRTLSEETRAFEIESTQMRSIACNRGTPPGQFGNRETHITFEIDRDALGGFELAKTSAPFGDAVHFGGVGHRTHEDQCAELEVAMFQSGTRRGQVTRVISEHFEPTEDARCLRYVATTLEFTMEGVDALLEGRWRSESVATELDDCIEPKEGETSAAPAAP